MKIIHYRLSLFGVDKDKKVMIKEISKDILGLTHNNSHELTLTKSTNKLKEDDYSLTPAQDGCSIAFDDGEPEREYTFTLNEEFVKEFEQFIGKFIDKEISKIENDFK